MSTFLARAWFVVCAAFALAGPIVGWHRFEEYFVSRGLVKVAKSSTESISALVWVLLDNGIPESRVGVVAQAILAVSLALKAAVFIGCAGMLARHGKDRPFPLILAGGVLAYGLGMLLPTPRGQAPEHFAWVFSVNLDIAVSTLALATVALPDGSFLSRRRRRFSALERFHSAALPEGAFISVPRIALLVVWVAATWLFLHPPVNHHWDLHRNYTWRPLVHVVLLLGGLGAMGVRYFRSPEFRLRMKWVLIGIAASFAGFGVANLFNEVLPSMLHGDASLHWAGIGEMFSTLVQPVVQSCAVIAVTLAVIEEGLTGNLKEYLPKVFKTVLSTIAICLSTLLLEHFVLRSWPDQVRHHLEISIASLALSIAVFVAARSRLSNLVDYVLFPSSSDRGDAAQLGVLALEDTMSEKEVIWAVGGIFEHGWPGCWFQVLRLDRDRDLFVALDPLDESVAPSRVDPADTPTREYPLDTLNRYDIAEWMNRDGQRRYTDTHWFELKAHGELIGVMWMIPSPAGFSSVDRKTLQGLVEPISMAVWRVTQKYRFSRRSAAVSP